MPNEISVVFQNSSIYDYHFIIKELANDFEGKFEYIGENTGKYKPFSISIEKEVSKTYNYGNESVVTVPYKIKCISSARYMTTSLSNLADNITEGIHKIKCKDCDCFPEYESVNDNSIKYGCLFCNKNYLNKNDKELKKRLKNIFQFSNNDINNLFC